jgi:catechol 2,3-dioxygenase-like lactoylglutathione lyase family enzyme
VSAAPFTVEGLHHMQLAMPPGGEPEARRFYGHVLMFDEVAKPEHLAARGGCWFRSGPLELHMGAEEGFRASAKAHPAVRVRGLAALRARLEAEGVALETDTDLEAHERWYVRDPFGNRLEFIEQMAR